MLNKQYLPCKLYIQAHISGSCFGDERQTNTLGMEVKKATVSGGYSLRKHSTGLGLSYGTDAVQRNRNRRTILQYDSFPIKMRQIYGRRCWIDAWQL